MKCADSDNSSKGIIQTKVDQTYRNSNLNCNYPRQNHISNFISVSESNAEKFPKIDFI
jgi:hypothetical protein